jgi:hypothetical protein
MKKNLFYLFILLAAAAMPLTSCEKDPQEEQQEEIRIPLTSYDGLSYLQGSLVVVDENGELFRRVYGKSLDISLPDIISVPVKDLSAAERVFLSWVAPDKDTEKVDSGYDYVLTDHEDKPQGSVSFRSVEGEAGVVARMSVEPGTDLKHISEVQFIDSDFWPENAAYEKVEAGKIYNIDDYVLSWTEGTFSDDFNTPTKEPLPFYCIQGNTDGKEGILVWLSPDSANKGDIRYHHKTGYYAEDETFKYLATISEINKVREFYDNNQDFWNKMLKEMDAKGLEWSPQSYGTNSSNFIFQSLYYPDLFVEDIGCLDLNGPKSNKCYLSVGRYLFYDYHRYMHVEIIPPVAE